ncbi:MAG: nucleotidyltransferase family protein, partial [Sandaracinaceae bacterium]|nr:nucleotidyltransferase family protein [Sandaracinaceae bacterium]
MHARTEGRTARLAASLIARRDLIDAVKLLNRQGILPMPLKGVLLQHLVYRDPSERVLSDVDLLVPPGHFDEAVRALRAAGYALAPEGRAAVHAKGPSARLEIDLHRRLFAPGLFGLSARHLFERGHLDERLFDCVVVVPSAED